MNKNNKKLWILLAVLAVIIIIVIVAVAQSSKTGTNGTGKVSSNQATTTVTTTVNGVSTTTTETINLTDAKVAIPGSVNQITKDNKVVTPEGKPTVTNGIPNAGDAPKPVLIAKEQLPSKAIDVVIKDGKFTPNLFAVAAGSPVSFAITSGDNQTHIVIFTDNSIAAIAMGIGPNETKAITFNAPTKPGDYTFRCEVPGHGDKGEVGKMVVK